MPVFNNNYSVKHMNAGHLENQFAWLLNHIKLVECINHIGNSVVKGARITIDLNGFYVGELVFFDFTVYVANGRGMNVDSKNLSAGASRFRSFFYIACRAATVINHNLAFFFRKLAKVPLRLSSENVAELHHKTYHFEKQIRNVFATMAAYSITGRSV